MGRLQDKIAVVTGAGSGIGKAVALRFVQEGAVVIAVDIGNKAQQLACSAQGNLEGQTCDVSDPGQVERLFDDCRKRHGRLDVLVNNAGVGGRRQGRVHEQSIEDWDYVLDINLRGAFLVLKYALPLMIDSGGGAIVNMASIGAFRASPNSSPYLSSKGGMMMLTRAAALDYARDNIRINAVCPGMTNTDILQGMPEERIAVMAARCVQNRLIEPEEVASMTLYLCSDEASALTGGAYLVDGGRSAGG